MIIKNILFTLTPEQIVVLKRHYKCEHEELEEYEIGELLDKLIDDLEMQELENNLRGGNINER